MHILFTTNAHLMYVTYCTSYINCLKRRAFMAVSGSHRKQFLTFTFFLQKRINSLPEAFIHTTPTPRSRVRHVLLWMDALYWIFFFMLNENTHPLPL